jgi:Family of unknown function (DUF6328)
VEDNVASDEAIEQRLGENTEDEQVKERLEREHGELLEELRALIPGAEVLFGFLLAIRFTGQFTDLNAVQRYVYYATLVSTAVSLVMLLAPSAYHRLRFREGDKDMLVRKGTGRRSPGRAPSRWPSRGCCTSSPTCCSPPKPRSRSRWSSSR